MAMRFRSLLGSAFLSLLVAPAAADAQTRGYPAGEATEVYRAALDLLYIDGNERPSVIVMLDTVAPRAIGPCPQCPGPWKHRSTIDTSTILGFGAPPYGIPPIRKFRYRVPIRLISFDTLREMARAGEEFAAAHPADSGGPSENALVAEFRRRFPGAWGWTQFTVVGFNNARTEALLGINQNCGELCSAREIVFFRKIRGKWMPIERVPAEISGGWSRRNLRYRGPALSNPIESELLTNRRPTARDERAIYEVVLDSLYSFHGERPGTVVVSDRQIPGTTIEASKPFDIAAGTPGYQFFAGISDAVPRDLRLRRPLVFLTRESRQALERDGPAVQRIAVDNSEGQETSGFWLAFRLHYPRAWGYAELSRIGYDSTRTRAIMYASHRCGEQCHNGDTWLLTRRSQRWSIADRIPREELAGWYLDSLRYLGRGAQLRWYKPGRARGVFRNYATGDLLRNFDVMVFNNERHYRTLRTDDAGRYSIDLPRFGSIFWKAMCPGPHGDTLHSRDYLIRPGLDTIFNVELEPRMCLRLPRTHPLLAGDRPAIIPAPNVSPQEAAVYESLLDWLLPQNETASLLIQAHPERICDYCLEREAPRLLRKGLIKLSTEDSFLRAARDSGPPPIFRYRKKLSVFPPEDQAFLRGATDFWDVMKDAYPGVTSIVSFSEIGFDNQQSEALVEFRLERPGETIGPEMMLLRKSDAGWRVALRDVARPATSGEWSAGKCEPTDAPAVGPRVSDVRTLVGTYMIVRVQASRQARGSTDTSWVRLSPLKPRTGPRTDFSSDVRVLDSRKREQPKIASTLEASEGGARIIFRQRLPEGVMVLDGWHAEDAILRIDGTGFYGRWSSQSGPTVPHEGHFCARKID